MPATTYAQLLLGPEHTENRPMDKLDLVLIPLLYLFCMTLTLISVAIQIYAQSIKILDGNKERHNLDHYY